MIHTLLRTGLRVLVPILSLTAASAHIGYGGRNFGAFSEFSPTSFTISTQTVTSNFGWADATDLDFGDSHKTRIFRFTLRDTASITISVTAPGAGFLPGFSIYEGLAHIAPAAADHDFSTISQAYLASLGGTHEGALNALGVWKVGSDDGVTFSDLSTFTFEGYAVDGTSANFGSAPGVVGDGLADGFVTGTFDLRAGDYTLVIGGANYEGQAPTPDATVYPFSATVSNVPEPSSLALAGIGVVLAAARRRRSCDQSLS